MRYFECIAIGDEVLAGTTVNANAAFIAQALLPLGWQCTRQTVIPDEATALTEELEAALARSSLVVTTGGLGPTLDDRTRPVLARLFHTELAFHPEVAERLYRRFGRKHPIFEEQATIPQAADPLFNEVGTAPGLWFSRDGKKLVALPGVPGEMRAMVTDQLVPRLSAWGDSGDSQYRRSLYFIRQKESDIDQVLREIQNDQPLLKMGIYPQIGAVSVHLTWEGTNEEEALAQLNRAEERLLKEFGYHRYEGPSAHFPEAVHALLRRRGRTLAVAESCTGGALASALTSYSGASDYFLGGVVAYANAVKVKVLGVAPEELERHGAVSEPVVKAMAEGVRSLTGADFALATSGVAGPSGGSEEKPVGTVWLALARKEGETHTWRIHARGNRERIIEWALMEALAELFFAIR